MVLAITPAISFSASAEVSQPIPVTPDETQLQGNSNPLMLMEAGYLSLIGKTKNSITVNITVPSGAHSAQMSIFDTNTGQWDGSKYPAGLSSGEYTFTGLNSDSEYHIAYFYYTESGNPPYESEYLYWIRTLEDDGLPDPSEVAFSCDINEDRQVDSADLSVLLGDYGKTKGNLSNPLSDINEDGQVDAFDLSNLLDNYGKISTITVGFQEGILIEGIASTATFTITTTNIANGKTISLNNLDSVSGISLETTTTTGNSTTVSISTTTATPQGEYLLSLTIDGVTSNEFYLYVEAKKVVVTSQQNIAVTNTGGSATFTVMTDYIDEGSKITLNKTEYVNDINLDWSLYPNGYYYGDTITEGDITAISISKNSNVPEGMYPLSLTIDGVTSNEFYLVVTERTVIVGGQNEESLYGENDPITFTVYTESIPDGTYSMFLLNANNLPSWVAHWGMDVTEIEISNNVGTLTIDKAATVGVGTYPSVIVLSTPNGQLISSEFYIIIDKLSAHERPFNTDENGDPLPSEFDDDEIGNPDPVDELNSMSSFGITGLSSNTMYETPDEPQESFSEPPLPEESEEENYNDFGIMAAGDITFVTSTTTSITVTIKVPSGATSAQMKYRKYGDANSQNYGSIGLSAGTHQITGLTPHSNYYVYYAYKQANGVWVEEYIRNIYTYNQPQPTTASISASNITHNSFSLNVQFPTGLFCGNPQMYVFDPFEWKWNLFQDTLCLQNGTYQFTNIPQGTTTSFSMAWYVNGVVYRKTLDVTTTLPLEVLLPIQSNHFIFRLEAGDVALFNGSTSYSTWRSWCDENYEYLQDLTGLTPYGGSKIEIRSERGDPSYWARSGNPIMWNRKWIPREAYSISKHGHISFGISHEIGHDFDIDAWNFDAEHFANFKMAYMLYKKPSRPVRLPNHDMNFYDSNIKNYYKSISDVSYDKAIASGHYYGDAMTYTFLNIKDTIGWEPFRKTFRYFSSLDDKEIPDSNLGKLNLFLSKLQDYSSTNVFSSTFLPTAARNLYESYFGGTIGYVYFLPVRDVTVSPSNTTLSVGQTVTLSGSVIPSSAPQGLTWTSSNESVATVSSGGTVYAHSVGVTFITAKSVENPSKLTTCKVTVEPLLIYQTRNTETKWFGPNDDFSADVIRDDLLFADMTEAQIKNSTIVSTTDFGNWQTDYFTGNTEWYYHGVSYRKQLFSGMCDDYFTKDGAFKNDIVPDMINHFMGESSNNFMGTVDGYSIYKNSNLTAKVNAHENSTSYTNSVKTALNACLTQNNGSLSTLEYNPELRYNPSLRDYHPFVAKLKGTNEPVFSSWDDMRNGFTICINSLQGNKIEILTYIRNGNSYRGTIKITYYDHFGIDLDDYGYGFPKSFYDFARQIGVNNLLGFRQWIILQRWNNLGNNLQPKPFITTIEILVPFSGTIN